MAVNTEVRVTQDDKYAYLDDIMMQKLKYEMRCWDWANEFNEEREKELGMDVTERETEPSPDVDFGMPGM